MPGVVTHGYDEPSAHGVDEGAAAGGVGKVERDQLVGGDAVAGQVAGHACPCGAGVPDQPVAPHGLGWVEVDAAVLAEVGEGELVVHRAGPVLPRKEVHGIRPVGRHLHHGTRGRGTTGGRWRDPRYRCVVQVLDRLTEAEPVQPGDVVDDVAGGAAAEAVEPVRDAAHGQGGSSVVVERAAAHAGSSGGVQLDTGGGDDVLDAVPGPELVDIDPRRRPVAGHSSAPLLGTTRRQASRARSRSTQAAMTAYSSQSWS